MVSKSRRRREAKERAERGETRKMVRAPGPTAIRFRRSSRPGPKPSRGKGSTMASTTLRQRGVDVIGVSQLTKSMTVGQGILRFTINPRALVGTRLGEYAQLWSRWRPVSLKLEISPSAGMMIPGGYIAAWSANPDEKLPLGESAVSHLASLVTQVQRPIGQPAVLNIPCSTTSRWYTFTGAAVDVAHGSILSAVSGTLGTDGKISITFKLHWTIEFNGPDVPSPVEEMFIEPGAGWMDIFTDSVSDWGEGKKLTFKMHEGGAVVPWPNVRSGVIYKPTTGVKIPYVKADGTAAEVAYCSRIIDSDLYASALACHATEAAAKAYQKNADLTQVLDFKSAGAIVVPSIPRLMGQVVTASFLVDKAGPSSSPAPETDIVSRIADEVLERLKAVGFGVSPKTLMDSQESIVVLEEESGEA